MTQKALLVVIYKFDIDWFIIWAPQMLEKENFLPIHQFLNGDVSSFVTDFPSNMYLVDKDFKIYACSDSMAKTFGHRSSQDVIGKSIHEFPPAQYAPEIVSDCRHVFQTGETIEGERICLDCQGHLTIYSTRKVPLKDSQGNVYALLGFALDITAQKMLDRKMLEIEKLEKSMEHLEREKAEQRTLELKRRLDAEEAFHQIALQANHDIGSPLLVLDLFAKKYLESAPEDQRNSVRNSIARIRSIASSMLVRFSSKTSTDSVSEFGSLIMPSLYEVIHEKRLELEGSNIQIADQVCTDTCFSCLNVDPEAFKRMISNIVNNSVDALRETPEPMITMGVSQKSDTHIEMTLSDNGSGMSESVRQKILNQIPVTSDKQGGYGIGYVQIRQTLASFGGQLDIRSSEGRGTKVTLSIPTIQIPKHIASVIELESSDMIVVADDDPSIHEAWNLRFSELGQEVKHFTQGEEAYRYINSLSESQRQRIFFLSDYEFINQNLNGIELINRLNLKKSILVTSHYSDPNLLRRVRESNIKMLPKILADKVSIVFKF